MSRLRRIDVTITWNVRRMRSFDGTIGVKRGSTHEEEQELSGLFSEQEERDFRSRWTGVQSSFVDEPRRAVEQADELVAQTMQRLAQSFSEQKKKLETHWEKSEQISTEELRMALRRYRSFFDRLLSV
jgi:hypothetical protein